ncbi:pyridoxal 5'-phosphate synthase glutaminase subunit PdxT [Candidatus Peregrinibacteria bacterium]|nr:pyridoxal 5'-phosphate synthase glutaminase subunit PdxT [Candidatus Peregrinibacteria bacterium]
MKIGVLGFHGSVFEHERALKKCGAISRQIRCVEDLDQVNGLILPGGESTALGKFLHISGLHSAIIRKVKKGFPVYGTCAGAILLAQKAYGKEPEILRVMDIEIERNAYGRQIESFITLISAPKISQKKLRAVFIRAPKIVHVGPMVEVLAKHGTDKILVREGNLLASTFHPEMTDDTAIHRYFIQMCKKNFLHHFHTL